MPLSRLALDTQYASWPITPPAGTDITSDTAQVAFQQGVNGPLSTWYPASIVIDPVRYGDDTPRIRFLLGPGTGGVTPGAGSWRVLGRIFDSPETPVLVLDTLTLR